MTYIRTIFIGLGGAGIQTIDVLKQKYITSSTNGELPKSIKFLAIDSDYNRRSVDLTSDEFVLLGSNHAYAYYLQNPQRYNIPERNINYLRHINGAGSGMCRSNGKYLFRINQQEISDKIRTLYHELSSVHVNDAIPMPNIDVHIITSSGGGTGSGMFIELSKLIRTIIPNSRVFAYLYSDTFYKGICSPAWSMMQMNTCASTLEMTWSKDHFDFCVLIGDTINNSIISLEDAQKRLSEMLKYASGQPQYFSHFEILRDHRRICNFISVGCHKLTYVKERLVVKLIHKIIQKVKEGNASDDNSEYINIVNDAVQKLVLWGDQGYNVYGQNILLFDQDMNSKVPSLIEECYRGLTSKINDAIRDSSSISQILLELDYLELEIYKRLYDNRNHHKRYDSDIRDLNYLISDLNYQISQKSHFLLLLNRRAQIAALNNQISALNTNILKVNYKKKTLEAINRTCEGVLERIKFIREHLSYMIYKLDCILNEAHHSVRIKDFMEMSDVTSLIDINNLPFDETSTFDELFSDGLDSVIEYRRFIEIIEEHIANGTWFNYLTNPEMLLRHLQCSCDMREESIGNIVNVCEEWFLSHPSCLRGDCFNYLHQQYNNAFYDWTTDDNEIIIMYKKGYMDFDHELEKKLLKALRSHNERYCPFSDSNYETRFC